MYPLKLLKKNASIFCEDSSNIDFLKEEGIEKVDAFVANEQDDAQNLLLGSIGVSLRSPKVIAASRRQELFPLFEKAGILPVTSSRLEIINRLLSILHQKTFLSIGSLSNDLAKIVELKIPSSSKWAGSSIAEISHHLPKESLLGVIENHGRVLIGRGDSILCPDDRIIALCSADHLDQLHTVFGRTNVPLD
jgi:trk system potassium uptake protein